MKRIAAALILFAAVAATASPVMYPDGRIQDGWPVRLGAVYNPTPETCEAAGYTMATPAQVESQTQADAAAQARAEAEAAAQAGLPQTSETGYAVLDDAGHWVELIPTGDGLPVIGAQVSNSPLTKEQHDAMRAQRKAAHDALKAKAQAAKTDKEKIAVLMQAAFGITE